MSGYNFTDRVRTVLQMARDEAARLHHEYVGTEHILLALILEGEGVAVAALTNLNVDLKAVKWYIEATVKQGKAQATRPDLPYTSRAKKILEFSMSEARDLNHSYIGTEHLLLGVLREEKGIAAQALVDAGVTLEMARAETLRLLGTQPVEERRPVDGPAVARAVPGMAHALLDHWFRTAIALIELHHLRFGQYPQALKDLQPTLGPFDQPVLRSVRYEKLDNGYALDVVALEGDAPTLNYPPDFWRGLGLRRTNVEGFNQQ